MLQEIKIIKMQDAIREVEINRAYYDEAKFRSFAAWDFFQNFVDEDPRFEDPKAPEEEIEYFRDKLAELKSMAFGYDEDLHLAHQHLEDAKARLLALYDQEEISHEA